MHISSRPELAIRALPPTLLLFLAAVGQADESYTIKIKHYPSVGKTVTLRETTKDRGSMKLFDADGKLLSSTKPNSQDWIVHTTVLAAAADGRPTKFVRTFERGGITEDGVRRSTVNEGCTFLVEYTADGEARIGVANDPTGLFKDVRDVRRSVYHPTEWEECQKQLAPPKPVRIGDTWSLDLQPISKTIKGSQFDLKKSTGTAKLVRVYEKGKSTFGAFDVRMKLHFRVTSTGANLTYDVPASYEVEGQIDLAIDGSSTEVFRKSTARLDADGQWKAADRSGRVVFADNGNDESDCSGERDDPSRRVVPKIRMLLDPDVWSEFKPKGREWVAKFPGAPTVTTKELNGDTETQWTAIVGGGVEMYAVAVTEFADPSKIDPQAVLKAAVGTLKNVKSKKEIELNGVPGMEIVYEPEASGISFVASRRVFIVNGRAFDVTAAAVKGRRADAERFFKSFQLLKNPVSKDK